VREQVLDRHTVELRLMGRIAAGRPLERSKNMKCYLFGELRARTKLLRWQSEGQLDDDDHILNGDYVVVERPGWPIRAKLLWRCRQRRRDAQGFLSGARRKDSLAAGDSDMAPLIVPAADVKIQDALSEFLRKY